MSLTYALVYGTDVLLLLRCVNLFPAGTREALWGEEAEA